MRHADRRLNRAVVYFVILAGLFAGEGCATFQRDWHNADNTEPGQNRLDGRWQGTWRSDVNGHGGALRCVVSLGRNGALNARFHATYRKMLGFGYTVPLSVTETNGLFHFSGQANLGWWAGGLYHYEGQAGGTNFFSTYRCKYDHGTFQMTRPD